MPDTIRVRFAPSPTGMLHIGGLRTALYNYLFARRHKGSFILRIEDTDQNRYVDGAEDDIKNALKWAGLQWDEGPDAPGDAGPYRQSERSDLYQKYAYELIEKGFAYYAFDSADEIEQMRDRLKTADNPNPKYDANTRSSMKNSLSLDEDTVKSLLEANAPYVIRLKTPENETIRFHDLIRGDVSFQSEALDDQVLMKSDGLPTYHLANVVDDHLMGISHVIRGEEWLSSAPKHLLLYKYLGWDAPKMAHLPLIMSPAGGKLSKRNAEDLGIPVNVGDYIRLGYEPEALINFLALLGWSPGDDRELFTLTELSEAFSFEQVGKAGAVFNIDKLTWFNEHYLRARDAGSLLPMVKSTLAAQGADPGHYTDDFLKGLVELMKERVSLGTEMVSSAPYFFAAPSEYDEKTLSKAWKGEAPELLREFREAVSQLNRFTADDLKATLSSIVEARGLGFGKLMLPARLAITGTGQGPDLFRLMELLGKDESLKRIDQALEKL